ncbi:hypothetical protein GALL_417410 [mine drainage metagenome]|uniref:Uncharacterized protein n=1 Tax=mine drainage metagenome TaxID=410659 RepID=A0A1J5QGF1_9ZZZZ
MAAQPQLRIGGAHRVAAALRLRGGFAQLRAPRSGVQAQQQLAGADVLPFVDG